MDKKKYIITQFDSFPADYILLKLLESMNKQIMYYPDKIGYEYEKYEIVDMEKTEETKCQK